MIIEKNAPITNSYIDFKYHWYFYIIIGNMMALMKPQRTLIAPKTLESFALNPYGSVIMLMRIERLLAAPFIIE